MKVCIAEKPSVAREIAQVLGATTRKDGYMEGNGYQVTWTFGHLCTLGAQRLRCASEAVEHSSPAHHSAPLWH